MIMPSTVVGGSISHWMWVVDNVGIVWSWQNHPLPNTAYITIIVGDIIDVANGLVAVTVLIYKFGIAVEAVLCFQTARRECHCYHEHYQS